jgi:1,4-dihydroxy-6-naphthoate synthase
MHNYQMLNSGGALGKNCGPLLVSRNKEIVMNENLKVAIPGLNTTANFLLSLAYPQLKNKTEVIFSDIEHKVKINEFDLGLIIHESRFTYESKGLSKVLDLGQYWEEITHSPLPLGGIVVKRGMDDIHKKNIDNIISESVKFAFENPEASREWTKLHSQELEDEVIQAHIKLYVNNYSIGLGSEGIKGVYTLFEKLKVNKFIEGIYEPLIVK